MDNGFFFKILKNSDEERAIKSITGLDGKFPLTFRKSHRSAFFRIPLRAVLGNGKAVKRSLILKEPLLLEDVRSNEDTLRIFSSEIMVNNSVLKEIEYLMDEFNDTNDTFWCKLLHNEASKALFFEDLEALGFKHMKWNFFLDLDHCLLVLRNLGRYHGICKVLEEREVLKKEVFPSMCHFSSDENFINYFFISGLQVLRKGMMKYWGFSWDNVAEGLNLSLECVRKKLKEAMELKESSFNVLNHGDFWINNLMFKYGLDNRPYLVRFMNFQCPVYNSPCLDITFFLYMSVEPVMRRNNFNEFVQAYYDSLMSTLNMYGFRSIKPTLDNIHQDMNRLSFFGLIIFAVQFAVFASDKSDTWDLAQLYEDQGKILNIEFFHNKTLIDKMIPDLVRLIELAKS